MSAAPSSAAPAAPAIATVRTTDGADLAVYLDGAADAAVTLVLAHGWTLDAGAWAQPAGELAADGAVRVVRYDQRGHGRSTGGSRSWSIDLLGEDLAAVLAATAPAGPVVLGGHSMGGMTVMALAAARPELFAVTSAEGAGEGPAGVTGAASTRTVATGGVAAVGEGPGRIAGVLLTSTSAGRLDPRGRPEAPLRLRLIGRAESAFFGYCSRTVERSERLRARLPGPDGRLNPFLVRRYLYGPQAPRDAVVAGARMIHACPMAAVADWFPALMLHDKAGSLGALGRLPVEIVVGALDRLTPVPHSRRLAEELPEARLRIEPGCGHMLLMERAEVVTESLRRLCDGATGTDEAAKPKKTDE